MLRSSLAAAAAGRNPGPANRGEHEPPLRFYFPLAFHVPQQQQQQQQRITTIADDNTHAHTQNTPAGTKQNN